MPGWPEKILLPRNDIVSKMVFCNQNRVRPVCGLMSFFPGDYAGGI